MKVTIIESNHLRKNTIITVVESLGWDVLTELDSFEQIQLYLKEHMPDLIIANMFLGSESVIKQFIEETTDIGTPVLFFMAFEDNETANYNQFLLNPFNQQGLTAALSLLMSNTSKKKAVPLKGIEVRGTQQQKIWVLFEDILWIEVERNYCFVKTQNSRYGIITSLSKLIPSLDKRFIQIHRGCIVNSDHIDLVKMSQQELRINNTVLAIGRLYRANVMAYLANKK